MKQTFNNKVKIKNKHMKLKLYFLHNQLCCKNKTVQLNIKTVYYATQIEHLKINLHCFVSYLERIRERKREK